MSNIEKILAEAARVAAVEHKRDADQHRLDLALRVAFRLIGILRRYR